MTTIPLCKEAFTHTPRVLAKTDVMTAAAFRYRSGVEAVRIDNARGYFILLPFQGQVIWRAAFDGHDLWMRTAIEEPVPTRDYLATYGGFLYHCGFTAMGCPAADDTHPLHGELPNIPYEEAVLTVTDDAMTLSGAHRERVAFTTDYTFSPAVTLRADATVLDITVDAVNNRQSPMDYMYLTHINFRPYDGGELIYSAPYDSAHVKVHRKFPAHMDPAARAKLSAYMDAVAKDPAVHHVFNPEAQIYNPEVCMTILYDADAAGFAHTMQLLPDGCAHYVSHEVSAQPYVIRWLSRTGDEDSCGMALPATAEHNGREQARRDGQLRTLAPGERYTARLRIGLLTPEEARLCREEIGK